MARNDIVGSITNTSGYNFPAQFQKLHGSLGLTLETNPPTQNPAQPVMLPANANPAITLDFTNYSEGAGGSLYIYACDGSQSWGMLFVTPPNASNYFNYAYFGWPKAMSDVLNYLQSDATTYSPSSTTYGFPPPTGSGVSSEMQINMQNVGNYAQVTVNLVPYSS